MPHPEPGGQYDIADMLTTEFIARYGAPMEIHTDQGRNIESQNMKSVCKLLGIHKTRTIYFVLNQMDSLRGSTGPWSRC